MEYNNAKQFILEKLEKELPKDLHYHNLAHVKDVYNTVLNYIKIYSIEGNEALMLRTAVLYHDSGYIVQAKGHEKISCEYARELLPFFGYSDIQVEAICEMIMATQIPQTPKDVLGKILADADLDYLGRDDFFTISDKLYLELKVAGIVTDRHQWNRLQVSFFESHHYFTEAAKKARDKKKAQNLLLIKAKL